MNYNHLTIEERCCIRKYYNEGKSFREIAELVGRNASTISRRNKSYMNCKAAYYPHTAQKKYAFRRTFCHRGMFWDRKVLDYIEDKLKKTWSPEQIARTSFELKIPSFKTIYRWIYKGYLVKGNVKVLRKKGKTRKRLGNGGRFTTGKSIRKRDKNVYKRREVGHWEVDTVVSGIGKSKQSVFCDVCRKKNKVLHSGMDAGQKSRKYGKSSRKSIRSVTA